MGARALVLRRPDHCAECSAELAAGETAVWDGVTRTVTCERCSAEDAGPLPPLDRITVTTGAGASAQREHDRRHGIREQRVRTRHPRLGGLLLALVDDPATTRVWARGAEGERAVGRRLDRLDEAVVLHDRRLRHPDGRLSKANIDHLAVTPSGIWVVDAKTHRGRLEVRRSGGVLSPRVERLLIRGRDRTDLVDGALNQVAAVRAACDEIAPEQPVHGALCFVGTELPWLDESIGDIPIRGRRGLIALLRRRGPLDAERRGRIAAALDVRFPPA